MIIHFFSEIHYMIVYDYSWIIIPLYNCYQGGRNGNENEQTNKTVTRLAKRSFKTRLKNTFYLIKLKVFEAFGEKMIF